MLGIKKECCYWPVTDLNGKWLEGGSMWKVNVPSTIHEQGFFFALLCCDGEQYAKCFRILPLAPFYLPQMFSKINYFP